jgi:hypothetical protein
MLRISLLCLRPHAADHMDTVYTITRSRPAASLHAMVAGLSALMV